jgi:hypothetical protein
MANKGTRMARSTKYVVAAQAFALGIVILLKGPSARTEEVLSKPISSLPPGIVWFSKSGLDTEHNKIDSLIAIGGNTCLHPLIKAGQCTVEKKLRQFLSSFPPQLTIIASELRSLGAVCVEENNSVYCIYEKNVNTKVMKGVVVVDENDDFFRLKLRVVAINSEFQYGADLQRISTPIKKNVR